MADGAPAELRGTRSLRRIQSPPPSVPTQDVLSETVQVVRFAPPTRWIDASPLNRLAYVGH